MTASAHSFFPYNFKRPLLPFPFYPVTSEETPENTINQALAYLSKMGLFAVWDQNGLDLDEVGETEQQSILEPQEDERDLRFHSL